jgi:hypothetical protein
MTSALELVELATISQLRLATDALLLIVIAPLKDGERASTHPVLCLPGMATERVRTVIGLSAKSFAK